LLRLCRVWHRASPSVKTSELAPVYRAASAAYKRPAGKFRDLEWAVIVGGNARRGGESV